MRRRLEEELDRLFAAYRRSFGEVRVSPQFLPGVWRKIEERKPLGWLVPLRRWSPRLAAAAALAAVLLIASLTFSTAPPREESAELLDSTYVDALTVDSLDERDGALWLLAGTPR